MIEWVNEGNLRCIKVEIERNPGLVNCARDDGVELICFAVAKGRGEIVEYLLEKGANPDAGVKFGGALHVAAQNEREDIVRAFLEHGADVNLRNRWQQTPLHRTTKNESDAIAKLLIAGGADVAAKDGWGRTPLHRCRSKPVAEALLAAGADVNAADSKGLTPLHWAAASDTFDRPTVELLLEKGADPELKDGEGRTPRELAKEKGQDGLPAILDAREEQGTASPNPETERPETESAKTNRTSISRMKMRPETAAATRLRTVRQITVASVAAGCGE